MIKKIQDPYVLSLILITIIGGALRFIGTNPGYNPYHADETMSYATAWQMLMNFSLDPKRYDYPSLIPIINLLTYVLFFIPVALVKYVIANIWHLPPLDVITSSFTSLVLGDGELRAMFWSRYVTAFVSTMLIPLVCIISKELYKSKLLGLFAAIILAVNYKMVLNSHFGLPDIYNAFFFLSSLYFVLNLLKNPTIRNYMFCGLIISLSLATKFQIFSILPFFLAHFYLVLKNKEKMISSKFLLALLIIPGVLILLNPYHLVNFEKFKDVNEYTLLRYYSQRSTLYGVLFIYHIALTPLISAAVLMGFIIALKRNFFNTLLLLSIPTAFLYTILFSVGGTGYTRNYVSVVPFLIIFSAYFFNWLFNLLLSLTKNRYISGSIVVVLIIFSVGSSFNNTIVLAQNYKKDWGMINLNKYINSYLGKEIINSTTKPKIAAHQWDYSMVLSKPYNNTSKFELVPLSLSSNYFLSELQEEGVDYAIIGLDIVNTENSWWMTQIERFGYKFWNDRKLYLSNQSVSLAVNELTEQTLFAAVKSWQAPDNNYLFVEIPHPLEFKTKNIIRHSFNDMDSWLRVDGSFGKGSNLVHDTQEGHDKSGSLHIKPENSYIQIVRFISPIFSVKSDYGYKIQAWVKSANILDKKNRDGFLRLDFYEKSPEIFTETTISMKSVLSKRFYGNQDWSLLEFSAIAPKKAKFASVSFQVASPASANFWIDDVEISESLNKLDFSVIAEKQYTLQDEILYPYSQGGL